MANIEEVVPAEFRKNARVIAAAPIGTAHWART